MQPSIVRKPADDQQYQPADKRHVQTRDNEYVKRSACSEDIRGFAIKKIFVAKDGCNQQPRRSRAERFLKPSDRGIAQVEKQRHWRESGLAFDDLDQQWALDRTGAIDPLPMQDLLTWGNA